MQASTEEINRLVESDDFGPDTIEATKHFATSGETNRLHLQEAARAAESRVRRSDNKLLALKLGVIKYFVGEHQSALEWLAEATDNAERRFFQACCYRELREYDKAIADFERAESRGADSFEATMRIAECHRLAGRFDEAASLLRRASRAGEARAEYHYQLGRLADARCDYEQANGHYEAALAIDPRYAPALFYLAYFHDLHGSEEEAVALYERCVSYQPMHVNALINLAVLYEDAGRYDDALDCLEAVLYANPNHARARLFRRDVISCKTMVYDEEQEKRIDRRNQVLEIPITDFELSVRSRNCLRKMNIRTIGDLLNITEAELLAYKNFGETSLAEVRNILAQKNLRLGQAVEESPTRAEGRPAGSTSSPGAPAPPQSAGVLARPVSELELSVRSRKCLQRLNISTIGDLVERTEAELLGCKNFGVTSLNEIKQKIADLGLEFRKLED